MIHYKSLTKLSFTDDPETGVSHLVSLARCNDESFAPERFKFALGPAASRQSQAEPEGTVRTAHPDPRTGRRC